MKQLRRYCPPVFDRRIAIETPKITHGEGGQRHETFDHLANVWAYIEPLDAKESLVDDRLVLVKRHKFIIRFRSDLTAAHRLLWQGRTFAILGLIDPDERGVWLELTTEEIIA